MKKHVRTITILAVALLLPMIMLMPISQAKRTKKTSSKTAVTQRPSGPSGPERVGGEARGNSKKEKAVKSKSADKKNSSVLTRMRAQENVAPTPISTTAVGFAATIPLRDMEVKASKTKSQRFGKVETNTETPEKVTRRSANIEGDRDATLGKAADEAARAASEIQPNLLTTPQANFEGLSNLDNAANPAIGGLVFPPDTVGDVGPNHYVQATNLLFRVFSKAGAPLTPTMPISALFTAMGGRCANNDNGDPIVLYDSFADRWIITQFLVSGPTPFGQCFAISQTPDPTGAYFTYDFVYPVNKFNDYPKFGVWPDGYYYTANQFNFAGTAFLGVGVGAFDRAKVMAGDPTAGQIFFDLETSFPFAASLLPSDADGLVPPPANAPNIMSYFAANEFGDPEGDALVFFAFDANFANPMASTFTSQGFVPVAAFNPITPPGADDIEQPAPAVATAALDSIGDRLMHRLQYRRVGNEEVLTSNHTVNAGTPGSPPTLAQYRAGVRYYELRRLTGNTGLFTIRNQQTYAPGTDTHERWMASSATDNQANLAIGYSIVNGSVATPLFPGISYVGRLVNDPANMLPQTEQTLQVGTGVQTNTGSRWGDYSSLNVDPNDDCTFFYTQEYYQTTDPTPLDFPFGVNWQTRVGSFRFTECTAPPKGTLTVNVTNCETGQPVQGASVSIDGNLYGSTLANGSFTTMLAPGTYSVSVTAPNFGTATGMATVTNGGNTVLNLCIQGVPVIVPAGSTITAESCSPADGALSPGETVTVAFGLSNSGAASTLNLMATLQATGGVTNIQPPNPQDYGAIPPDNTTVVSRPFTFTVDPNAACGSTITATLQLQDGTTNLGTVTFTLQVGAIGGSVTATYSSGNIAVPIPDVNTVEVPINVPDTGQVQDVNVRVRLNHTFDGDLDISLVHPDGTVILLSNNRGGAGQNFGTGANDCSGTPTVFDDEAAATIASGVAPFAGSFRPDQMLSGLDGKPSNGTWRLRVADTAALDVGTIGCVTLEITRGQFVCCGVSGTPTITAGPATLVDESCPPFNMAIDPGERVTINLTLINNGTGSTSNLVATLLPGGGVIAPSNPESYGVLTPTPPNNTAARDFTFTADPTIACGGSITATWQLQDGANNLGTVMRTFVVGTAISATSTFSNATPIIIPATGTSGIAAPYPSTINVAGVTGNVSKVTATLRNMNHTFPDDIDVLLVGPGGQRLLLMSDAGGAADLVNNTYTFDDMAASTLADGALSASGTYRPSNFGTGDTFPAPAPAGPYADPQLLSVFNGVNPNGTWSLYVVDDVGGDIGDINMGWELNITTATPSCTPNCGIVRLVVTSTLSRLNGATVQATYRIQNTGTLPANNVMLTDARLGATNGTPLPQNLGSIAPGATSAPMVVNFANSTPGTSSLLRLNGTYTGGVFNSTRRVTVP